MAMLTKMRPELKYQIIAKHQSRFAIQREIETENQNIEEEISACGIQGDIHHLMFSLWYGQTSQRKHSHQGMSNRPGGQGGEVWGCIMCRKNRQIPFLETEEMESTQILFLFNNMSA